MALREYVAALQGSAAYLIGVWLALKVASEWEGWSKGLRYFGVAKKKITGRDLPTCSSPARVFVWCLRSLEAVVSRI